MAFFLFSINEPFYSHKRWKYYIYISLLLKILLFSSGTNAAINKSFQNVEGKILKNIWKGNNKLKVYENKEQYNFLLFVGLMKFISFRNIF